MLLLKTKGWNSEMKMIILKQKNSLNEKIKCLEIENKMLHDKIISFKENKALHLSMKA